ncbi:MAG: hypothetical protein ACAI34_14360 [Verrucomicrobium sp.]|nr:hypothetical protein [Verrucomicrobium sp.]
MKTIGSTMFFFGVGSAVLHFLHMEFILLTWIETWGPGVAWAIRAGLAVVGGILWFMSRHEE